MAYYITEHLKGTHYDPEEVDDDEEPSSLDKIRAEVAAGREIKDPIVRAFIESLE